MILLVIKRQSRPSNLQHRKNGKTDLLRVNPLMYSFTLFETLPIVCLKEIQLFKAIGAIIFLLNLTLLDVLYTAQ